METKIVGRIRKLLEGIDAEIPGGDPRDFAMTQQLELLVANAAAPYREIVKMGRAFQVGTSTAVAAAAVIPSTTAGLSLYNGEPDGGRSYVIDFISAAGTATAAATGHAVFIVLQGQVREAIPTNSALIPKKLNGLGGGTNDTKARTILTGTALPATTGIAADWFPVGAGLERAAATSLPGSGLYWEANGRIICPPGRYFAVQVYADTTASLYQIAIAWHEVQLTLG